MIRKSVILAALLSIVAIALIPAIAEAETQELVSSASNSLCINPKGMKPTGMGGSINYAPLSKPHKGPFPETGKSCAPETANHPEAMAGPGEKAPPYNGAIPNASWVSINAAGSDASNPPPKYYIYNATFNLACQNQVAAAEINVKMFADNTAGAFLNGVPIGHLIPGGGQQNFDQESTTPHGPVGGWPFGPNVGAAGGFKVGLNTLQFVVLDETTASTGLDFSALVNSPPCEPWWQSNGKRLEEGQSESFTSSGTVTIQSGETTTKCKLKDGETIENPKGGGAGVDQMTEFQLTGCKAKLSPCPKGTKLEVIAANLPWQTHLVGGPPIRDVIEGVDLEVKCSGSLVDVFTGTLSPSVGKSTFGFGAGSGELFDPLKNTATLTGTDKLKGPPGDEKITAA